MWLPCPCLCRKSGVCPRTNWIGGPSAWLNTPCCCARGHTTLCSSITWAHGKYTVDLVNHRAPSATVFVWRIWSRTSPFAWGCWLLTQFIAWLLINQTLIKLNKSTGGVVPFVHHRSRTTEQSEWVCLLIRGPVEDGWLVVQCKCGHIWGLAMAGAVCGIHTAVHCAQICKPVPPRPYWLCSASALGLLIDLASHFSGFIPGPRNSAAPLSRSAQQSTWFHLERFQIVLWILDWKQNHWNHAF